MISWVDTHLGKYCDFILGGTPKTKESAYWNGNIPWASVVDFEVDKHLWYTEKSITERGLKESNTKLLKVKDVIISARGTVGKTVVCARPLAFNQSCYALRSKSQELDQNFLFYLINFKVIELKKKAVGGVFDTIVKDTLNDLGISLPPSNSQLIIASILSTYDSLIENNTRRIQILEEMAQRIYKEWFVDFKYPGHENDKLVDSELGMIPEGWSVKKLEKIVSEIIDYRGKTPKKLGSDWSDSGVMAISAKNVKQGKLINLDKSKFVDEKLYEKWMKTKLEVGDILMTSEAPLGELYYLNKYTRYCLSQRVFAIRADKVIINPTILYCALGSQIIHEQIQMRRSGTTVAGIRQSELRKIPIIVPSLMVQNKASDIFSSIFSKITTLQEIISNLRQTRDLLLPKLISGKIDVSDLDIDTSILND